MNATPEQIARVGDRRIEIRWSDGVTTRVAARTLRDRCPCATCREQRDTPPPPATALTVLSPAEAAPVDVAGMRPVGAYAYGIRFSDGHSTGLFSFELLRELGEPVEHP